MSKTDSWLAETIEGDPEEAAPAKTLPGLEPVQELADAEEMR